MLELLEIMFEIVAGIIEAYLGWRFYICLAAGVLLIALTYASLESLALAIPVGVLALTTGLIWDRRFG